MDRFSPNPENTNDSNVREKVPHGGKRVDGRELPVREFDNTTLEEAVDQGLIKTPTSPSSIVPPRPPLPETAPQMAPEKPERKKRTALKLGGAGLAIAVVAGGIGAYFASQDDEVVAAPEPTVSSAPVDPSEAAPTNPAVEPSEAAEPTAPVETAEPAPELNEREQRIEELKIPAGLSDEEFADRVVSTISSWINEGSDDTLLDDVVEKNIPTDQYLSQMAGENAYIYAEALFSDDWQTNPGVMSFVSAATLANEKTTGAFLGTNWADNPEDIEGYRSWDEVSSVAVVSSDSTGRSIEINVNGFDNSEKNSVEDKAFISDGFYEITTTVEGDTEYIRSISGYATE